MAPKYVVFISHAGEDKAPLAVRIYEGLKRRGISAFLDERELRVAGDAVRDMDEAMRTAWIGLFILSPEFALKMYPMLELKCFLRRAGLLGESGEGIADVRPDLVPIFYRLPVAGCKYATAFEEVSWSQVARTRFDERVKRGEVSMEEVLQHLTLLAGRTGIENKTEIVSGDTELMQKGLERLAENVCNEVTRVLIGKAEATGLDYGRRIEEGREEALKAMFESPNIGKDVMLDFSSASKDGKPQTCEAEVLREVLRNEGGSKVIALIGMGGVGKSCILRGIARLEVVKNCFSGGVYFISMGMDASLETLRLELLRILRKAGGRKIAEELQDERSMQEILGEVGKLIGRGRSLVLLDDVWERNGIKASIVSEVSSVLSNAYGGSLMLTTRSTSVASVGDVPIHIKPREAVSDITRKILLKYAKFSMEEVEREGVEWVVEKLQRISRGLPVCLAVVGRGVGRLRVTFKEKAWVMYWEKISSGEAVLRGGVDDYVGLNTSLTVALLMLEENEEASIEGWSYSWSEMYRSLCVMKKQSIMPVSVLRRVWKLNRAGEVLVVVEGFSSVGLAEVVREESEFKGLKVHDLLHDFATSLAKSKGETTEWHKRLLNGYISSVEGGVRSWWLLENDGYIFENVFRHLRESGDNAALVRLLLRVEWTNIRQEHGGLLGWKDDFAYCLDGMEEGGQNERTEELRNGLFVVRDAVAGSWPFITADERAELGFQMHGRLQEAKEWPAREYLESVREWQTGLWLKPDSECWSRPEEGRSGEIPLRDYLPTAVALYGEPLCAVLGTKEGCIIVLNLEEKRVVQTLSGHEQSVMQVAISKNQSQIFSYSEDNVVRQWDVDVGVEAGCTTLKKGDNLEDTKVNLWPSDVAFSSDCKVLVSGSMDGEADLQLWNANTGERVGEAMRRTGSWKPCFGISPDGSRVIAGGRDEPLRMWRVSVRIQLIWTVTHSHEFGAHCVAFSPDAQLVVSGGIDGTIRLWDASTGKQIRTPLIGHEGEVSCVRFSLDGKRIISAGGDCTVRVWDVATGKQVGRSLRGHSHRVNAVAVSDDGRTAVSFDREGSVRVWDLQDTMSRKDERFITEYNVECLAASLDKRFYVSGHNNFTAGVATIRVWDAASRQQNGPAVHVADSIVDSVAISPDSRHFVCGMGDGTLQVWDRETRVQIGCEERGHSDGVISLAYSADGQWLISGSRDATARVWSVDANGQVSASADRVSRTGFKRPTLLGSAVASNESAGKEMVLKHWNWIECVEFSADGGRVVCAQCGHENFVWETSSGKLLGKSDRRVEGNVPTSVIRIRIDGDYVWSLDDEGLEMRWKLDHGGCLAEVADENDGNWRERRGFKNNALFPRDEEIFCVDRFVRLGPGGPVIATLPARVEIRAWHYDSSRGVVVTGLENGQLLFSQLVRSRSSTGDVLTSR